MTDLGINYTTRYGEHCTATRNGGVVTISGDKFGVRQMPLDEFRRVYTNEQAKIQLERSPMQDTAEFCLKSANTKTTVSDKDLIDFEKLVNGTKHKYTSLITRKHTLNGGGMDVSVTDSYAGGYKVKGKINGKDVDLKLSGGFLSLNKGKIKGNIDGREVSIKYKGVKDGFELEGLDSVDENIKMQLALIAADKIAIDVADDEAMACAAIATGKI